MAEPTEEQLMQALQQAHAAGDEAAATQIAQRIAAGRQGSQQANVAPGATQAASRGVTQTALDTQRAAAAGREGRGPSSFGEAFIAGQPSAPTWGEIKGIAEAGRTIVQGALAYGAGMIDSIPTFLRDDSKEAFKVMQETTQALSYYPASEEGRILVNGIATQMAPIGAIMDWTANKATGGNEYAAEWVQSAFGAIGSPLRAVRKGVERLPRQIARAQENGYRIAVGEGRGLDPMGREFAARMGGLDATNGNIIHHNQSNTNVLVNDMLNLPATARVVPETLDAQRARLIQSVREQAGIADVPGVTVRPRGTGVQIDQSLNLRARAVREYAEGHPDDALKSLQEARAHEARVYNRMAHDEGNPVYNPEAAAEYRAKMDQLDRIELLRPLVNESGDIPALALVERFRDPTVPQRLWRGTRVEDIMYMADNFAGSMKAASGVAKPGGGASIFDVMLAPAVAGAVGLGGMAAGLGPLGGIAVGIPVILGARKLGRKLGARDISTAPGFTKLLRDAFIGGSATGSIGAEGQGAAQQQQQPVDDGLPRGPFIGEGQ